MSMTEEEQWENAIEIADAQIAGTDFMTVGEWLFDINPGEEVERQVFDKVMKLRANGDEHHTMQQMYEYRMLYNAGLFNAWAKSGEVPVYKSRNHSDGEPAFGGEGWFIVVAELPTGQISNHYAADHWPLFDIPAVDLPPKYDGHGPELAARRLHRYLEGGLPMEVLTDE